MPQSVFFSPMSPEAYQTYVNFWYTQAQAQAPTQTGQAPYPTSPATFAQPLAQSGVKLSKLVKEAKQLGFETFSRTTYAVMAKNWLKKVSNTLVVSS